jgi:protein O-mannosyl-transferase
MSSLNQFIQKLASKNSLVITTLVVLALFAYGNILFGDFVFDDNIFIENNIQIRSPSNIEAIYESSTTAGSGLRNDNFYRPNQQFIYTLLYSFFGLSPSMFHLTSVIFHILNALLIFLLFTKLGISRKYSLLGSSLFLLHPILTESVSYISGLSDPLVTFSILLTLLVFLKITKEMGRKEYVKWLALGGVVFAIGLFSKENQIVSLGLITLLGIYQYKRGEIHSFKRVFIFFTVLSVLSALYIYIRLTALNFTGVVGLTTDLNIYTDSLWVRLTTFMHALPEYLKMFVFPWHLYYEKPYTVYATPVGAQFIWGVLVVTIGLLGAFYSLFRKSGKVFLGIGWFFVALLPFSGIVPLNAIYLEHWLYVPIIGLIFILMHWSEENEIKTKGIIPIILICILLLFSFRIISRNMEWGNPVKFYENELRYTETSARIHNNLAMELAERKDCISAIPHYEKAISLNDTYPQTHHNLARCHEGMGNLENAANEYLKALYIEPNFSYSLANMANLLLGSGDKRGENFVRLFDELTKGKILKREDIQEAVK